MSSHEEYLLQSRCGFEQRNIRTNKVDGVFFKSVTQSTVKDVKCYILEFYIKEYKLSLQVILPPRYPVEPPTARLISDRDSVLPDHSDIDQSEGFIEREFAPGAWTPVITVRDFLLQVMDLLVDAGVGKRNLPSNILTMNKTVYGFYKESLHLEAWEYENLTRKSPKFMQQLRDQCMCRIRFYGGETRTERNSTYLLIEADEPSLVFRAKTKLQAHLSRAATERLEERVLAVAAAKQKQQQQGQQKNQHQEWSLPPAVLPEPADPPAPPAPRTEIIRKHFIPVPGGRGFGSYVVQEISGVTQLDADRKYGYSAEGSEVKSAVSEEISSSSSSSSTTSSDSVSKRGQQQQPGSGPSYSASASASGSASSAIPTVEAAASHITSSPIQLTASSTTTIASSSTSTRSGRSKKEHPRSAKPPQMADQRLVDCVYCFNAFPSDKLNEHQTMYCWRAPRKFKDESAQQEQAETRESGEGSDAAVSSSPSTVVVEDQEDEPVVVQAKSPQADSDTSSASGAAATPDFTLEDMAVAFTTAADAMFDGVFGSLNSALDGAEGRVNGLENHYVGSVVQYLLTQRNRFDCAELERSLREAHERMTCSVCLNRHKNHVLRCGHMFCGPCLIDLRDRGDSLCAVCRTDIGMAWQVFYEDQ